MASETQHLMVIVVLSMRYMNVVYETHDCCLSSALMLSVGYINVVCEIHECCV